MSGIRWVVVAVLVAGAVACKQEAPDRGARPAPISASERKRGGDACSAYLEKVCACARSRPAETDLAERCKLDVSLGEALELVLTVDDNPEATATDVWRAQDQARKIAANCLQSINEVAARGCP